MTQRESIRLCSKLALAALLAAFSIVLAGIVALRLLELMLPGKSFLLRSGNALLFWPERLPFFQGLDCTSEFRRDVLRCVNLSFCFDLVTYAVVLFPILVLFHRFRQPRDPA